MKPMNHLLTCESRLTNSNFYGISHEGYLTVTLLVSNHLCLVKLLITSWIKKKKSKVLTVRELHVLAHES